jgi:hypothetical protein
VERRIRLIVAVVLLGTLTSVVLAQRGFRRGGGYYQPVPDQPLVGQRKEWTFARLAYDGAYGYSRWAVDYHGAEEHF